MISFVDYRLGAPRDARLRLASEKSRQRPLLDRTHWPPLKASVEAGAFILPGLGVRALAASGHAAAAPASSEMNSRRFS